MCLDQYELVENGMTMNFFMTTWLGKKFQICFFCPPYFFTSGRLCKTSFTEQRPSCKFYRCIFQTLLIMFFHYPLMWLNISMWFLHSICTMQFVYVVKCSYIFKQYITIYTFILFTSRFIKLQLMGVRWVKLIFGFNMTTCMGFVRKIFSNSSCFYLYKKI